MLGVRYPVEEVDELVVVESVRSEKLLGELVNAPHEYQRPQRYHVEDHGNDAQYEDGQERQERHREVEHAERRRKTEDESTDISIAYKKIHLAGWHLLALWKISKPFLHNCHLTFFFQFDCYVFREKFNLLVTIDY